MPGENETPMENQDSTIEIDSWEAAFAALDKAKQDDQETTGDEQSSADISDQVPDSDGTETDDGTGIEDSSGESDLDTGNDREEDDGADGDMLSITANEVEEFRNQLTESVRDRAVGDMAQEFIKRGVRNTNGKLGASINDPDICKRDEDGVPRFYNPETGNEFTGDNPRRQAQEWVEDYNKELASAFNQACENYSAKLMEQEEPQIAVMEFASTYDKLDPARKILLDAGLQDYEIRDNDGDVIGFSIDLNTALGAVNRQVERLQEWGKTYFAQQEKDKPTGPVLDMKNSASVANRPGEKPKFNSLAEAMEWEQDQLLAKMKGNK